MKIPKSFFGSKCSLEKEVIKFCKDVQGKLKEAEDKKGRCKRKLKGMEEVNKFCS